MAAIINFLKRLFKGHGKLPYTYVCKDCQGTTLSLKALRTLNIVSIRKEATDKATVTRSVFGFGSGDIKPAIGIYYISGENKVEEFPTIVYANTIDGEVVTAGTEVSKETVALRAQLRNYDYNNLCLFLGIPMQSLDVDTFVPEDPFYFSDEAGVAPRGYFATFSTLKNKKKSSYRSGVEEIDALSQKSMAMKGHPHD